MSTKTIIACRPGMKQQMQAAFAGMEVVVDDKLDKDYEFRKEQMSLDEILEEEIAKEERQDADPKNAITFVIPMGRNLDEVRDGLTSIDFLTVRVENTASFASVTNAIAEMEFTLSGSFPDETINTSATLSALKAHLRKKDINVLSISVAQGLSVMGF